MMTASADSLPCNGTSLDTAAAAMNSDDRKRQIFRPVVFQCKQCRCIVADSSDLSTTDRQERLVSFRRDTHPNIVVKPEWQLKQDGFAYGSVYQVLQCRNCHADLGVRFHTTNADFDHLRGMLTLRTEALLVYELQFDDARIKQDIEEVFGSTGRGGAVEVNKKGGGGGGADEDAEITKLQKFCLVLYDRIVRLEDQVMALTAAKSH